MGLTPWCESTTLDFGAFLDFFVGQDIVSKEMKGYLLRVINEAGVSNGLGGIEMSCIEKYEN